MVGCSRNDMDDNRDSVIHNDVTRARSTVLRELFCMLGRATNLQDLVILEMNWVRYMFREAWSLG